MCVLRVIQAYTSQFVALTMFGLMMSEDRLSLQNRRLEIINGLKVLPGQYSTSDTRKVLCDLNMSACHKIF